MKKGVVGILLFLIGCIGGAMGVMKFAETEMKIERQFAVKHLDLFLMMNQWVKVKQRGKNLADYFEKHGYKKIAVYGMSYAGITLVDEIKGTSVQIAYGIDKKADSLELEMNVVTMEDPLEAVDAVIVTAITYFDEIEEELIGKVNCPIISLEDVLDEVLENEYE